MYLTYIVTAEYREGNQSAQRKPPTNYKLGAESWFCVVTVLRGSRQSGFYKNYIHITSYVYVAAIH